MLLNNVKSTALFTMLHFFTYSIFNGELLLQLCQGFCFSALTRASSSRQTVSSCRLLVFLCIFLQLFCLFDLLFIYTEQLAAWSTAAANLHHDLLTSKLYLRLSTHMASHPGNEPWRIYSRGKPSFIRTWWNMEKNANESILGYGAELTVIQLLYWNSLSISSEIFIEKDPQILTTFMEYL